MMAVGQALRALFYLERPHRMTGAQRQLLLFLRHAVSDGLQAHAVSPAEGHCVDAFRAAGVAVSVLPAPETLLLFGKRLLAIGAASKLEILIRDVLPHARAIAELAANVGAQVLHFNSPRGILAAGLAARMARLPAVLHVRGSFPFDGVYRFASQAFADRIVLNADALRQEIEPGFRERCITVHDGVEPPPQIGNEEARAALSARLGLAIGSETRLVLSLSSPVPFKGLHRLLEAADLLRRRSDARETLFLLAGSSEDERYTSFLQARLRQLDLCNVHLVGYVPNPELLVAGADVLVLPTVDRELFQYPGAETIEVRSNEGLPQAILEALAAGVPVVASRVAGTAEQVVDGVTGFLVPQGDSRALAIALEKLLSSPEMRRRMGDAARLDAATRFEIHTQARQMLRVLRETVGAAGRPGEGAVASSGPGTSDAANGAA